jgi:hypothetical protein
MPKIASHPRDLEDFKISSSTASSFVKVHGLGPWGRRFKSFHPDHYILWKACGRGIIGLVKKFTG